MADRKTVRPSADLYKRMNEQRKDQRLSWNEFFERLLERDSDPSDGPRIEHGTSRQLDRVEELAQTIVGEQRQIEDMINGIPEDVLRRLQ